MAIDKNMTLHNKESDLWSGCEVSSVRADSMADGIKNAAGAAFLFIAINADNTDYLPSLKILRDITNDPILIGTSDFSVEEQAEALRNGADFYGSFGDADENMKIALAVVSRVAERSGQRKDAPEIIACNNILIVPAYRKVFLNNGEISLTKMEFDILYCLVSNKGRVLSHRQIYNHIFNDDYTDPAYDAVKSAIKRLRKKLEGESVIESVRGVGYRAPIVDTGNRA